MKANAPERIWIDYLDEGFWFDSPSGNKSIEYIRKDAFIEKACVKLKKLMYDNLMFQGRLYREEIIENFVGDFRNIWRNNVWQ